MAPSPPLPPTGSSNLRTSPLPFFPPSASSLNLVWNELPLFFSLAGVRIHVPVSPGVVSNRSAARYSGPFCVSMFFFSHKIVLRSAAPPTPPPFSLLLSTQSVFPRLHFQYLGAASSTNCVIPIRFHASPPQFFSLRSAFPFPSFFKFGFAAPPFLNEISPSRTLLRFPFFCSFCSARPICTCPN